MKTYCKILLAQRQQLSRNAANPVASSSTNCLAEGRRSKVLKNLAEELQQSVSEESFGCGGFKQIFQTFCRKQCWRLEAGKWQAALWGASATRLAQLLRWRSKERKTLEYEYQQQPLSMNNKAAQPPLPVWKIQPSQHQTSPTAVRNEGSQSSRW